MDIETTKLTVMQKIMEVNTPSLLDRINQLMDEEMIVGYTTQGEPLTIKAYNSRLENGERQFASGEFISQEDLEKEAENW